MGELAPPVDLLLSMLKALKVEPTVFFKTLEAEAAHDPNLYAVPDEDGIVIHFKYAEYDAKVKVRRVRRTDDVPLSHALVQAGYYSPPWTRTVRASLRKIQSTGGSLVWQPI
jgi:hypothetical protein